MGAGWAGQQHRSSGSFGWPKLEPGSWQAGQPAGLTGYHLWGSSRVGRLLSHRSSHSLISRQGALVMNFKSTLDECGEAARARGASSSVSRVLLTKPIESFVLAGVASSMIEEADEPCVRDRALGPAAKSNANLASSARPAGRARMQQAAIGHRRHSICTLHICRRSGVV